ncbi:GP4 protein [Kafue kinda chacma baboon virus]|uniref:GP4 protein n=1 Tax=Kafue kinda chacma baboon virus TaxID=1823757 RepID=A0A120HVN4_9NIDO|nr:GP4 protein [Kafue kinda chacma baboon virus]AMB20717.1 GP4 protein [Kafue kinda chacma baboon virus]AMV49340.1 GP4 protein [Kafue kinda chacma baboon virus]
MQKGSSFKCYMCVLFSCFIIGAGSNNTSTQPPTTTNSMSTTNQATLGQTCFQCAFQIVNNSTQNFTVTFAYHENCHLSFRTHTEALSVSTISHYHHHDCWVSALRAVYQGYNVTINQTHYCYLPNVETGINPAVVRLACAVVLLVKLAQFWT